MKVGLHANVMDQDTRAVADALSPIFRKLSKLLEGEYGGVIEHLWIDLELIESHAKPYGNPRYPFRLQKRVSGRSHFGLPPTPDSFNVGHFSVRPDFSKLAILPEGEVIQYVLSLVYESTIVLLEKQKKLGGFDAEMFRSKLRNSCADLGYHIGV